MREGIECHYSPQKRMGRPPKRRFVEVPKPDDEDVSGDADVVAVPGRPVNGYAASSAPLAAATDTSGARFAHDTTPFAVQDDISATFVSSDPSAGMGLGFLDEMQTPNFDFLDLLPSSYHDNAQIDPQILAPSDGVVDGTGLPFAFNHTADLLGGINFDEADSSTADMSKALSDSLQRHWAANPEQRVMLGNPEACSSRISQSASSPESHSCLSSTTATTEDEETQKTDKHIDTPSASASETATPYSMPAVPTPPKAIPSIACGCLSSLYLALDSLSRLPTDIPSAMRIARNATKIAHDVIKCPHCSDSLHDDPLSPPPIQAFQNLMCLAALIPSACNAYASILEMLDDEAAAAKREGRTIYFSFRDIGGLYGSLGEHSQCSAAQNLHNQWLSPDTWRTAMRSILRIDVYGFSADGGHRESSPVLYQLGLKDVVRLLDERSCRRHDKMDALVAQGRMPNTHYIMMPGPYKPVPPEQRNCIKILEAARIALDNLVIA